MKKDDERLEVLHSVPFLLMHIVPFAAFATNVRRWDWMVCFLLYAVRMFFLTAGYHRYFSHKSYTMGRIMQFVMAFGGTTTLQKGVLWWAAHHRVHHRFSDTQEDPHSPKRHGGGWRGLWWSHVGWILCRKYRDTQFARIKDFARYPELRLLNTWWFVPPALLAFTCWTVGGWSTLVVGFFLSTVLLYHGTFMVNSLAHLVGKRRFATNDDSRNFWLLALITGGEGWHNNHHQYPYAARQGLRWWEIDTSYYVLKLFSWLHLVRNVRRANEIGVVEDAVAA